MHILQKDALILAASLTFGQHKKEFHILLEEIKDDRIV
jgi:hypothetical protein